MPDYFIDPDISVAKTLDAGFYRDKEIFEECKEKIFAASWQFIGNEELVDERGKVYPFILLQNYLDEALLLTRDESGSVHLLSNVCTHRANIVSDKPCLLSQLRCRYHGRVFTLGGNLVSMPEFREVRNFPAREDNLRKLNLFSWNQWLFVSIHENYGAGLFFKDMMERVSWMPLNSFRLHPELSRAFQVKAHWALYCENYLEGFHIPFVHPGLNAVIDFGEYATELFFPYSSLQLGLAKKTEDCFDLPASSPDFGKKVAAYYFWVFPNMMFNFYPWGLSVNVVEPVSPEECRVCYYAYVSDNSKLNTGAGGGLDKVEMEDEAIVENVQRGIRSRFYKHGRYSVTREKGIHHFHRILADFLNS